MSRARGEFWYFQPIRGTRVWHDEFCYCLDLMMLTQLPNNRSNSNLSFSFLSFFFLFYEICYKKKKAWKNNKKAIFGGMEFPFVYCLFSKKVTNIFKIISEDNLSFIYFIEYFFFDLFSFSVKLIHLLFISF